LLVNGLIDIKNDWYKYKTENVVETGKYLVLKNKPNQNDKNFFPIIAANHKDYGFNWLVKAENWVLKKLITGQKVYKLDKPIDTKILKETVKKIDLRVWQKEFIKELINTLERGDSFRQGLIVGLGGGKTLVALLIGLLGETLYIAPKHLKSTIKAEVNKWFLPLPKIVTPESCQKVNGNYTVCILDESLSCKNPKAQRTKKVKEKLKDIPVVIAMTGVPLSAGSALDLRWLRIVNEILPGEDKHFKWNFGVDPYYMDVEKLGIKTRKNFKGDFVKPLQVKGWRFEEISEFVKDHIKIINISDIMEEIPEVTYQKIFLPQPQIFIAILKGLLTEKTTNKRLTQARACSSGFVYADDNTVIWTEKKPAKIEWLKNFIENNPTEPIVIFSGWRAEIQRLTEDLKQYNPVIVGQGVSSSEIEKFIEEKTNILICSAALTEGLNLQRSRIAIWLSNSTNPTKRIQAKGRLYRQGQKRAVLFIDLLCKNTLDLKALELLEKHLNENEKYIEKQLQKELEKLINERRETKRIK